MESKHIQAAVIACFEEAHRSLADAISLKYHSLGEEMISHLFWCELQAAAKLSNQRNQWTEALMKDLQAAHPYHFPFGLQGTFDGLICEVQLHNHHREGRTGGDFGLFVSQPKLVSAHHASEVRVKFQDSATLVQAKLKKGKSFGRFQKGQAQLLAIHSAFSTLALYSYGDDARTELRPFEWKACAGADPAKLRNWLKNSASLTTTSTREFLGHLFSGAVGTDDPEVIRTVVATSNRPRIEFAVRWDGDTPPEGKVIQLNRSHQKETQRIQMQW
ncbi:MAG: hypothetical protein RLZZ179_2302 [Verrucomicrobiota bacterium]|jgi:hypothetical protein